MVYALVEDVAASWERYERAAADLERFVPPGLILHAAGRTDEGFRIIEIWESEEAWRRFVSEADGVADGVHATPTRYRRDLAPTHLVLGRGATWTKEVHE